jgi:TolB-like protein/DNA-binding winged helix-turn-helix (wHTH) protein/Flp pilus assembly protein TadD
MTSGAEKRTVYSFEGFRLDAQHRVLSRASGEAIPLPPKVLDTLLYFVERPGELLDKRRLLEAIWPHVVVEENSLNQAISQLRRVLGERPEDHRFIVTEPGRGFRFVATVSIGGEDAASEPFQPNVGAAAEPHRARGAGKALARLPYWAAAAALVLALALTMGAAWRYRQARDTPLPKSIAVLPFENLSADPDDAFFAVGLHGEIINQLSKISALNVIGQPSMLRIAAMDKSIPEIARELKVETVLHATVQYADGRVRIIPQLVAGDTGKTLWAERYDRDFDDVFAIESDLAREIAKELEAELTSDEQTAVDKPPTKSSSAYALYLQAQSVRRSSSQLALEYLGDATRLDPDFALAYAAKAEVLAGRFIAQLGSEAASPAQWDELERETRAAAERALALESDLWLAHVALGNLHERRWRWTEAEREYVQAAHMRPGGAINQDLEAWMQDDLDFRKRIRVQREIIALDPLVGIEHWVLGLYHAYSLDATDAAAAFREAVALEPDVVVYHVWLAHAEGMLGNRGAATAELRRAEQLPAAHASSITIANLAYAYAQNGLHEDARRLLGVLETKAPDRRHHAGNWALAYLAVGDFEEARNSLEQVRVKIANEEPDAGYLALRLIRANMYSDPALEEPSFAALRKQLKGN